MRRTYKAIEDMILRALLHTRTARDIVRKGVGRVEPTEEVIPDDEIHADLWGQYALVNDHNFGSVVAYSGSVLDEFPANSALYRLGDFQGISEARVLATVTKVGVGLSDMSVEVIRAGTGEAIPFVDFPPFVFLDELGVHVSEWVQIDWPAEEEEQPAFFRLIINNYDELEGTVGLGLCQLQVRG